MKARLLLEDGSSFEGKSFGAEKNTAGEVVFTTGMVGYPESMTDASYGGQILIFTYPIMGSYGVPTNLSWESQRIQPKAIIVSDYIDTPSHFSSEQTLGSWLKKANIPGIEIKDTRVLAIKLREKGTMLGKIVFDSKDLDWYDPNTVNIVAEVSTQKVFKVDAAITANSKHIVLIDCGSKRNIARSLVKRGVQITVTPWDYDIFDYSNNRTNEISRIDALVISNGPGDPKMVAKTIQTITKALQKDMPILGICLGHQLLALAAGGDTEKLKFGHRSQNQPCIMAGSKRCYITTQNHGFAVSKIPEGFDAWFVNANDGSNEGIKHKTKPIMSVQFHPEARPGPTDTEWIFDYFLERVKGKP